VSVVVLATSLILLNGQPSEPPEPHYACDWSSVWQTLDKGTGSGEITPPRRRKGSLGKRPHPNPGENYSLEGPWIISAVIDAKGSVVDARVMRSAAQPPWPRYEAALLKSVRKWEFTPALKGGKPIPVCFTLRVKDR
jgi:TonB family protein